MEVLLYFLIVGQINIVKITQELNNLEYTQILDRWCVIMENKLKISHHTKLELYLN